MVTKEYGLDKPAKGNIRELREFSRNEPKRVLICDNSRNSRIKLPGESIVPASAGLSTTGWRGAIRREC